MCPQSFSARAPTFPVAGTSPNASLVTPHICASLLASSRSRSRSRRGFRFRRHLHDAPSRREARAGSPRRRSARGSPCDTRNRSCRCATAVRLPRAGRTGAPQRLRVNAGVVRARRCRASCANNRTGARGNARGVGGRRGRTGRPRTCRASRRRCGGRASSSPPGSDARLKRSV